MENKTALQQFIEWGDKMMLDHPLKVLSFAEAIDKAAELLEVEKEQIIDGIRAKIHIDYNGISPKLDFTILFYTLPRKGDNIHIIDFYDESLLSDSEYDILTSIIWHIDEVFWKKDEYGVYAILIVGEVPFEDEDEDQ